jgi:Plavaka transposase
MHLTTTSGGLEAHPVYLTLANINGEVRAKVSSHAWLCVAYIPIPTFKPSVPKDFHTILSARIWHHCIDICMESLKKAASYGATAADAMGNIRHIFTPLVAWVADNPEQHLIAGVTKNTSPISTATILEFGDAYPHPPRSGRSTLDMLERLEARVNPWDVASFITAAKGEGLNGVHKPFWCNWHGADPANFLTPEILHAYHKFFFDHPLAWCKKLLGATELDERFKSLHVRVGYRHLGAGVSTLKQISGRDHRNLQCTIVAIITGATPPTFVMSIRALVDFIYQVQAPTFTDTSIRGFLEALQEFHDIKSIILETGDRSGKKGPMAHFNIPKLELLQHFGRSVRALGSPMQWTADVTEHLHVINCKQPFRATNHHNFEEQCV